MLVGCQGSHGHIRIPLDVSMTGDRSSCFVADFCFDCVSKNIFFLQISVSSRSVFKFVLKCLFLIRKMCFFNKYTNTLTSCSWIRFWFDKHVSFFFRSVCLRGAKLVKLNICLLYFSVNYVSHLFKLTVCSEVFLGGTSRSV